MQAATTSLTVTKYDAHGNVLATKTVSWEWIRDNLPVQGDGVAHYYHEGPNFDEARTLETLWDPTEAGNIDSRDYGAAKGTDIKDLCDLVGGAASGDTVKIKATDNFTKWFDYEDIYDPEPEQGKIVLTWYTTDTVDGISGYMPDYTTGMRILFFAETTNTQGKHVFGDWDMHETLPESRWHYYYDGTDFWPSSSGLSVQVVSNIDIYQPNLISCDDSGNTKDSFAHGDTVYVKGLGLSPNTSYKIWLQDEPVVIVPGGVPLTGASGHDVLDVAQDPSGTQEMVTTDASGDFGPLAVWNVGSSAMPHKYDIVGDNQAAGTIGTYDTNDAIDNPGWSGFAVTPIPGEGGATEPPASASEPSSSFPTNWMWVIVVGVIVVLCAVLIPMFVRRKR